MTSRHELPAVVANTDVRWFNYFRPSDELTHVDEVNFWRPSAQTRFQALKTGEPFFLRLKAPYRAIAGVGFFADEWSMSVDMAWEIFGEKNGDPHKLRFANRISDYRRGAGRDAGAMLSCIVLRSVTFFPSEWWLRWEAEQEWSANIVSFKTYDLATGAGQVLNDLMQRSNAATPPDLVDQFALVAGDQRDLVTSQLAARVGQGAFRFRLLRAYEGQCAVTGEHSMPVLDAAHIQPYLGPASNHVQNGLVLRTDLHRLYDAGYVTVTPNLEFEVSRRLADEFENGKAYYAMQGRTRVMPQRPELRPSREALDWHATNVFR